VADLVARARATPGGLNFTNPGSGSTPHLAAELLRLRTGIELVQVAHNSAGLAVQALLAGTTQVGATSLPPALAQVKGGTLRALAVTASERFPDLPEVPTMQELGYPDFVSETFISMFLPLGTPAAIVGRLAEATLKVVHEPGTKAKLLAAGFNVSGARGPEALADRVTREVPMWRDLIRRAGIAQE
jgi:tripartite-type tricarboxylate transporter receptor subunit TctC